MAPRPPVAGTSLAPAVDERAQVDLSFSENVSTLYAMDRFSRYSMLVVASPKHPSKVREGSVASRIAGFGKPLCLQMVGGGERESEIWTDLRSGRNIRVQFQAKGASP